MEVMGISGMPGSGKSLVSKIAIEKGAKIVSMGDIIREEAKKRNEDTKTTAQKLREEYGDNIVAELTIKKVKKIIADGFSNLVIIEGIRSPFEINLFKNSFDNFIVLSIFANPTLRFERLKERQRDDDSKNYEEFVKRDEMELNFGIGSVIALSDKIIINEADLDSYVKKIEDYLSEIMMS